MNSLNVKKGDKVVVISGKEKGKTGKVMHTSPTAGTVVIEGVNMVKRHTKPKKQGDPGGILSKENPVRVCKVMCICPKCDKPTRVGYNIDAKGKSRVCKKCGAQL